MNRPKEQQKEARSFESSKALLLKHLDASLDKFTMLV
jgi:hypothetical protein